MAKISELIQLDPDAARVQRSRAWLRRELANGTVIPFHSYFPSAYRGEVNLTAWLRQDADDPTAAPAPYNMQFEPYFIAKPPFQRFDEAFRGRGHSKSSWFMMNAINGETPASGDCSGFTARSSGWYAIHTALVWLGHAGHVDILTLPHIFLFCRSDFDSHHDAAGKVTSSGKSRPINVARMHQVTKALVKENVICPEVAAYRHRRLILAVRDAAEDSKSS